MRIFLSRVRALLRRRALDARLDEEVRAHLEELAAEYERRGATREQARRAARRAFGGVEQMKEAHRDQRALSWAETLRQDVSYTGRQLRRRPAMTMIVGLVVAWWLALTIFERAL